MEADEINLRPTSTDDFNRYNQLNRTNPPHKLFWCRHPGIKQELERDKASVVETRVARG